MRGATAAAAKQRGRAASAGRFLRVDDVVTTTGLSRRTIYRLVDRREFPRQVALTARCVGWWEADVAEWLSARAPA